MKVFYLLTGITLCGAVIGIHCIEHCDCHFSNNNCEKPLILTNFIESSRIEEARSRSKVKPLTGNINSFSGFFTVNKTYNSNMFFWFFPAQIKPQKAPVMMWLQGGPGASSTIGLFFEFGPYIISEKVNTTLRPFSWTETISVLFMDNPVGAGFSFTDSKKGYARNLDDIAENLHEAIRQFFVMFPELMENDFYIAGESYGGKYIPGIAHKIHETNTNIHKINLKGLCIGNSFIDPLNMLDYGDYLEKIGLISENGKQIFNEKSDEIKGLIQHEKWIEASEKYDALLNNVLSDSPTLFTNLTGYTNYYNFLITEKYNFNEIRDFVMQDYVREAIHVWNSTFSIRSKIVKEYLKTDFMKSVAQKVETLLEKYKILFYSGQFDIKVAYPLTVNFLKKLKWSGSEDYKTAERNIWKVGNQIAGYWKVVGNLNEVLVRNAGHLVPVDQPLFAQELINRFVFNSSHISP